MMKTLENRTFLERWRVMTRTFPVVLERKFMWNTRKMFCNPSMVRNGDLRLVLFVLTVWHVYNCEIWKKCNQWQLFNF